MIPKWKITREARRIQEQLKALLMKPVYWLRQRHFDNNREARIEVQSGALEVRENVVVLLAYQPNGLPESLFHTLSHLKSEGFSTLIVLNSSVSATDFDRLNSYCAIIMKRPNFGYDFGGYRDAMLHLIAQSYELNSITCINDSIWFPVFKNCDHLSRMLERNGHLVGYSYSKGFRRRKNAHVQSYLFMFKGRDLLASEAFRSYWSKLKVSNSRHFTIRNSEMKMTRYFESRNFGIGWLFSSDDIQTYYESCADDDVLSALTYLNAIEHHGAALFSDIADSDLAAIRKTLIAGLKSGKLSRNVIGSEPSMLFQGIGFGAMKKSKSYNYQIQRKLAADLAILDRFEPTVAKEITALVIDADSKA